MEIVYEADKLAKVKERVEKDMSDIYESALAKKKPSSLSNVPIPIWFLLFYLGYDRFFYLITSIWIIPISILAGTYFMMDKLGINLDNWVIRSTFRNIVEKIPNEQIKDFVSSSLGL